KTEVMIWTHIFDLLLKAGAFVLIIIMAVLIPELMDDPIRGITFIMVLWVLSLVFVVRTPGSWLYCRIRLKMPVSFSQASKLNHLLSPNPFQFKLHGQEWLPLLDVLEVESEKRFDLAMEISDSWEAERAQKARQTKEELRNAPGKSKVFLILFGSVAAYCFIAAFAGLPPANYYIRLYCQILDTREYSVSLIACLIILTIIGPIALIKKLIQRG
ncbi:MAG: hypothetical protein ACKVOK_16510, partial [Flavobacteriales bacterium]